MSSTIADQSGHLTTMGLHELPARVNAWVVSLQHSNDLDDKSVLLRLLEIGFLPGVQVRAIARGFPSADPIAVRVGHTTFALRQREAAMIRVSTSNSSAAVVRP